jgi:TPR repeat protein
VGYGRYFKEGRGGFVPKDQKVYLELLEQAANKGNPCAMHWLGDTEDEDKAVRHYHAAAELGWKGSMDALAEMWRNGIRGEKNLPRAVGWAANGDDWDVFWMILRHARRAFETEKLDGDFDQLCYSLGWGLYWYQYGTVYWDEVQEKNRAFACRCLYFYCACVELQQKSILTFLLCWNRTVGVKDVGVLIGKKVWEGREDILVKPF